MLVITLSLFFVVSPLVSKSQKNQQVKTFCPKELHYFYPAALKDCRGIVFTHGVWMCGRSGKPGKSLSRQYLRNCKV